MAEKKAPISIAEMHRAAYASRNMTEKYYDDYIGRAKKAGNDDLVKMREASRDGCLEALDARLKMDDVLVEFEDDFRLFYRDLLERRRLKIKEEEAKRKDAA